MSNESGQNTPQLPEGTRVLLDPRNPGKIGFVFTGCPCEQIDERLTAATEWVVQTFQVGAMHVDGLFQRRTRNGDLIARAVITLG